MAIHNYTPRQALDLLLSKMQKPFPELFQRMKDAIDSGSEVQTEERVAGPRGGRPSVRYYRKDVPYTDEEALAVALTVLESHLVESRRFIAAAEAEFQKVEIAPPKHEDAETADDEDIAEFRTKGKNMAKAIEIEQEPETVLEKRDLPNVSFESAASSELEGLEHLLRILKDLTTFTKGNHGHTR